mmetsp:Transcript_15218/g.54796  ORF Transcript_15218/g.54796 Transcript_15218/m.54796 type:complete len:342 (+) Transcript_15218:484-1509(+)|eukprot:10816-Pelagococcus_subviridis.AAC.10
MNGVSIARQRDERHCASLASNSATRRRNHRLSSTSVLIFSCCSSKCSCSDASFPACSRAASEASNSPRTFNFGGSRSLSAAAAAFAAAAIDAGSGSLAPTIVLLPSPPPCDDPPRASSPSSTTVNRPFCTEVDFLMEGSAASPPPPPPPPPSLSIGAASSSITVKRPFCTEVCFFSPSPSPLGDPGVGDSGRLPGRLPVPAAGAAGCPSATAGSGGLPPKSSLIAAASARISSMLKFHDVTPLRYSACDFFSAAASVAAAPLRLPAATAAARSAWRAFSLALSSAVRSPSAGIPSRRCFTRKSGFFASFMNRCSRSFAAVGRLFGSFWRHTETKSRSAREK